MNKRQYITIILLIVLPLFSYGQDIYPVCAESVHRYGVGNVLEGSTFIWSYEEEYGEIISGEGNDTITIRWKYGIGETMIEVLEVSKNGCTGTSVSLPIEVMAPYVDIGVDYPEICEGDSLILSPGSDFDGIYEMTWHDGSTSYQYIATKTENIWVRVQDGHGCFRYDTVSLLVNPLPKFSIGGDTVLCDKTQSLTLDPGSYAEYKWTSSTSGDLGNSSYLDIYPVSAVEDSIFLTVTDFNYCSASDTIIILPCDLEAFFSDINNTITPNGDGENDVWNLPRMHLFDDAVLEIFDRWGRLVFRTENVLEEPWDGTSQGKDLPMDSYYYILKLNAYNTPPIAGTVNLIR